MAVPWSVLVSALPTLIESAGKLFNKARTPAPPPDLSGPVSQQIDALAQRLARYEDVEAEQARLMKQTVEQLQALALKAEATETRANIAIGIACVGAVLAGLALFFR